MYADTTKPVSKIKPLLVILLCSSLSISSVAQPRMDWKSHIDFLVEQTDSLAMKSQKTFYLPRIVRIDRTFKNDLTIKETWNYTLNQGKVVIFQVRYVINHREYTEIFYLNNDRLICMESYETPFLATYIDEVRKGEIFFLVDNTVKQYIKFGNTRMEDAPHHTAELACLSKFEERFSELRRNIKY